MRHSASRGDFTAEVSRRWKEVHRVDTGEAGSAAKASNQQVIFNQWPSRAALFHLIPDPLVRSGWGIFRSSHPDGGKGINRSAKGSRAMLATPTPESRTAPHSFQWSCSPSDNVFDLCTVGPHDLVHFPSCICNSHENELSRSSIVTSRWK